MSAVAVGSVWSNGRMTAPLRVGILGGSSRIYRGRLLPAFEQSTSTEVVAEASRNGDDESPYAALLRRSDVDAVYIPLPNHLHGPWINRALEAGKHVLCEKPLTMSAIDTDVVFNAAEAAGRVLLEAYMWPHHPRARLVRALAETDLGELRHLHSTFSFALDRPGDHRLDRRGGGAVFDVGIYCLAPAMLLAGRDPVTVRATALRNEHEVDVHTTGYVDWGSGFTSSFEVSFECPDRRTLEVAGTQGILRLEGADEIPDTAGWHAPGPETQSFVRVTRRDGTVQRHPAAGANAFVGMIDQFAAVVAGTEEPVFGPTESRRMARVLDRVLDAAR